MTQADAFSSRAEFDKIGELSPIVFIDSLRAFNGLKNVVGLSSNQEIFEGAYESDSGT